MISSPYCAVSAAESMLFVTNHIPYRWGFSNSFFNSFTDFYSYEVVSSSDMTKVHIHNGGWHETLNLLHVSSCEMLHFLISYIIDNYAYMKQNKTKKRTPESVQYRLEIVSLLLSKVSLSDAYKKKNPEITPSSPVPFSVLMSTSWTPINITVKYIVKRLTSIKC